MTSYKDAEIYITKCSCPRHSKIKYIGLDTKRDPDYLGSSVVLKWWINYIGRKYFYKEILETVSGGMGECCRVEQDYILKHNAIKDPNYLNMSGGKPIIESKNRNIDMEFLIRPISDLSNIFISKISDEVRETIRFIDQSRIQMVNRVISLVIYGYLRYDQEDFEYNKYNQYGSCHANDTQAVLSCLTRIGYIDTKYELISITPKLVESLPIDIDYTDFESTLRES